MAHNAAPWAPACSRRRPPALMLKRAGDVGTPVREAKVASGLILLLLIGILIGFGVSRVRKRMGLGVTWGTWVTTVVVVGMIVLLLWVTAYKH
jgi:fumarate reductase subunit D